MASKEDIISLPHADLRKTSVRIHVITDETLQHIEDMTTAALDWEDSRPHEVAVALAAVQIDRLERIVIVRADFDDKENRDFTVLINPEIIKKEGEPTYEHEGCLSVRDIYGNVPRYPRVRVKAIDASGNEVRIKAEGFIARVLQHEIDHTNGLLFIDHIDTDKKAFFTLTDGGDLEPLDYDIVKNRGIFRD
ncbi:peptide deformylase [Pedobacter sp.]|nr:peptide deformylase [Candidatus Saccharibacteria bacterium]